MKILMSGIKLSTSAPLSFSITLTVSSQNRYKFGFLMMDSEERSGSVTYALENIPTIIWSPRSKSEVVDWDGVDTQSV